MIVGYVICDLTFAWSVFCVYATGCLSHTGQVQDRGGVQAMAMVRRFAVGPASDG
eukprot:SAG31_NODE_323_length_17713_cov_12.065834_5_plen_55_part_00